MNPTILVIPCISSAIRKDTIFEAFKMLNICDLDKIDLISNKKSTRETRLNVAFIHIRKWYTNENASFVLNRLGENKDIKIVYEYPWYWKISVYKKNNSA
jgi:hypothetical protein